MKHEFETRMPLVTYEKNDNLICFDEEVITRQAQDEEPKTFYLYNTARVPVGADYPTIVTAIIRTKYTEDDVEAILLNGIDTPEHKAEYDTLQAWRKTAKQIAHQVIGM